MQDSSSTRRVAPRHRSQLLCAVAVLALGCDREPARTAGPTRIRRFEVTIVEETTVGGPVPAEETAPWTDSEPTLLVLDRGGAGERLRAWNAPAAACCSIAGPFARAEPRRSGSVRRTRRVRIVAEEHDRSIRPGGGGEH